MSSLVKSIFSGCLNVVRLPHRLLLVMMLLLVVVSHTFEISRDWIKIEKKFKKHLNPFTKRTLDHGRKWSVVVGKWSEKVGNGRKLSEVGSYRR